IVAVSDFSGGAYDPDGLDVAALHEWVRTTGKIAGYPHGGSVTNAELLELSCDILVLAALEDQVTGANAERVHARMVAEGANGPASLVADAILGERGIPIRPAVLPNAGGLPVSY